MTRTSTAGSLALSLLLATACTHAQDSQTRVAEAPAAPSTSSQAAAPGRATVDLGGTQGFQTQTFYLTNTSQLGAANEILVALRNLLPANVKIYMVGSQNAIIVQAGPDQLAAAQKLIRELDRPHKTYRLLYTITDLDDGKPVGTQQFSMVVVTGQQTSLKSGSKVPVLTGTDNFGSSTSTSPSVQTQFTYLDVGMNFQATLDELEHGARLRSKVEESSIAEEKSGVVDQDPIVRQSVIEGTAFLTPGKPLILGSLDVPGSTRRLDIGVMLEEVQ